MEHGNLYLYGAFFEMVAQLVTRFLTVGGGIYETRHLVNALFGWLGIAVAYKLGTHLINPKGGFFAALFLALTPVYYGHLFNNSKDVPFAAGFILALYLIIRSYDALPAVFSWRVIVPLAVAIGLTMGIRIGGIILLQMLAGLWISGLGAHFYLADQIGRRAKIRAGLSTIAALLVVAALAWAVMLVFWPWAQQAPLTNPFIALKSNAKFAWGGDVLFAGQHVPAQALPASYIPQWLAISLPEFYLFVLGAGLFAAYQRLKAFKRTPTEIGQIIKIGLLVGACIAPPIIAVVLRSTLYDGIRHFLFILPPLATLTGVACAGALEAKIKLPVKYVAATVGLICLGVTVIDMAQLHPYQIVYFNRLVAGGLPRAAKNYETDYWGSSYKEGIEWLAKNYQVDNPTRIRLSNCSEAFLTGYYIGQHGLYSGKPGLAQRFIQVESDESPHIFLATTRYQCNEHITGKVLHIVERQATPLLYVFELRPPPTVAGEEENSLTLITEPLPSTAFRAEIKVSTIPSGFKINQAETIAVKVKNASPDLWRSLAPHDNINRLQLGNHWLDADGNRLKTDDGRSHLPKDVKPGETVTINLRVTAPDAPGKYVLEFDMVQEAVSWFEHRGSGTLSLSEFYRRDHINHF